MDTKENVMLALADAITQAMWIKGLITLKERDRIKQQCHESLSRSNC